MLDQAQNDAAWSRLFF